MNFDINIDKAKNMLTITIALAPRRRVATPNKKINYHKMKKILDDNLKLPKGYKLGECIDPFVTVNNSPDSKLSAAWEFKLVAPSRPKTKTSKKSPPTRHKSTKKVKTAEPVKLVEAIENPPEEK
jgi:hypothetical protein